MAFIQHIAVAVVADAEQAGHFTVQEGEIHPCVLIQPLFQFGNDIQAHTRQGNRRGGRRAFPAVFRSSQPAQGRQRLRVPGGRDPAKEMRPLVAHHHQLAL
ncbi:hypothetical protein D3C85_1514140 [compost metagenome]